MTLGSRWLVCGLCSAIALALAPAMASAQTGGQQCTDMQMLQHKCGEPQSSAKSNQQGKQQGKQENKYPNATRKEPKVEGVQPDEAKSLNAGLAAANGSDAATALKDLQPIADSSKSAYAKALATLGLAQVKYQQGDTKGAIVLEKQALDSNALPNNNYFPGLQTLAQMYIANEDYADALQALDTWNKESGAQSAGVYALQGNAYYRMQKYPQAVAAIKKAKSLNQNPPASWNQIEMASYFAMDKYDDAAKLAEAALAKDPNNSTLLQNVIAIYVNAGQDQKALALLERARANGQIKDQTEYLNMAKMYDNIGQRSSDSKADALKAVEVVKEGMGKGIVKPDSEAYTVMGNSYAIAGNYKQALAAFDKAAPGAKTGEVDFMRGQVLLSMGRNKDARDALKQATTKGGFKNVGAAYMALGNAQLALKNKAGAIDAFQHAEQDPASQAAARRSLQKLGKK